MLGNKNKNRYEEQENMDSERFDKVINNINKKSYDDNDSPFSGPNDSDIYFDKNIDTESEFDMDDDDEEYSPTRKEKRLQSMYVINLTPSRMGILLGVLSSLVLMMFILGFQFGVKKNINNVVSSNTDVLFRANENVVANVDNFSANNSDGIIKQSSTKTDIVDMSLLSENPTDNSALLNTGADMLDVDDMLSKDLDDMGNILDSRKEKKDAEDMLDNYLISEPASYIGGEKSTSLSTFPSPKNYNNSPKPSVTKTIEKPKPSSSQYSKDNFVYFIQVAVANSEKSANIERDYLRGKSFSKAFVVDGVSRDGSVMYKLKIGRYDTKGQAEDVLVKLKSMSTKYNDSYVYPDNK